MRTRVGSMWREGLGGTAMDCQSNTKLTRHWESRSAHAKKCSAIFYAPFFSICQHTCTNTHMQSHEDVEKMGVANYNAECRKIVMRYSSEWETIVTRMGRWIDFKNDYKTLYPWFMESIWCVCVCVCVCNMHICM